MYADLTQTQYRIIYVHNVNTIAYLDTPEMYRYCVLFIVFEAACPSNVAWNAWLWHLVVLRKLQESTTVWVTLALAFLHAFNKKVICNNWLENYRKTIYWYQPFLCKPKANLRATLPLSESTRCANTWVWYVKFMLCFSIVIIPFFTVTVPVYASSSIFNTSDQFFHKYPNQRT